MNKGGTWFALSLFGMLAGGIFGSSLGLLLMFSSRRAAVPIQYSRWGFYVGAFFGAHAALTLGMRKMDPHAKANARLQVFGLFGALMPALFLLACQVVQSSAR
jgi:hypothetical protein